MRTVLLTVLAMVAFAANALLCRLALGQGLIDAATFATVRVFSGAVTLMLIVLVRRRPKNRSTANWRSAATLSVFLVFFSFGYVSLNAGTGALILSGVAQLTMFIFALRAGEHFALSSWAGLALAVFGLVYLVSPGVTAPDLLGAAIMTITGIAWGLYSLMGRGAADPLESTARNFVYSVPLVLIVSLLFWDSFSISTDGLILAVASGAIASGCGYVIWYAALPSLTATRAATVQLSVPAIAAFGGVIMLSEELTLRLLVASAATLGGVAIVLAQRGSR
jgi:drug/metabolite transporter (DMT)-like permease